MMGRGSSPGFVRPEQQQQEPRNGKLHLWLAPQGTGSQPHRDDSTSQECEAPQQLRFCAGLVQLQESLTVQPGGQNGSAQPRLSFPSTSGAASAQPQKAWLHRSVEAPQEVVCHNGLSTRGVAILVYQGCEVIEDEAPC